MHRRTLAAAFAAICVGWLFLALAHSEPQPAQSFPAFETRDIAGAAHQSRELVGRPALVIALTDSNAGDAVRAWWNAAESRLPREYRKVTIVSLRIPPLSSGIARGRARGSTPRDDWPSTWLDGNRHMASVLGLAKSRAPYVFVLDASGKIVVAAHCNVRDPCAAAVWRAIRR